MLDERSSYVAHRLARVGDKPSVFSSEALSLRHETTLAQLRDIDRLGTTSPCAAARRKIKAVERELMLDGIQACSSPDWPRNEDAPVDGCAFVVVILRSEADGIERGHQHLPNSLHLR